MIFVLALEMVSLILDSAKSMKRTVLVTVMIVTRLLEDIIDDFKMDL